jgi:hypothetical protein
MAESKFTKLTTKENVILLLLICTCIAQALSKLSYYKMGLICALALIQPSKRHRIASILFFLLLLLFLFFRRGPRDRLEEKRAREKEYRTEQLPTHFVPETHAEFSSENQYS